MNDDPKKSAAFPQEQSYNPFWGIDLGRELGSIDSRLNRMENDILDVKKEIQIMDSRLDKCVLAINRMDERTKTWSFVGGGIIVALIAGFLMQFMLLTR